MIESGIIWWMGQHLLITTALAAIVFLICCMGRPNPATRHVLWLLVLCRLLVPPMVTWPWAISVVVNDTRDASYLQPAGTNNFDSTLSSVPTLIESQYDNGHDVAVISPSASGGNVDISTTVTAEDGGQSGVFRRFQMAQSIAALWAAGSLIIAVFLLRRIRRVGQLLKTGLDIDTRLQNEIADCCDRLIVQMPDCVVHPQIRSPFMWCLGCVRLVLPLSALHSEHRKQVRPILIHELAHLKRRDHWTAWVELIALVVWWWNPVLWFVRRQLRVSAEMACDAWVVKLLPDQRRTYAESLVEFSNRSRALQRAFGVVGANTCSRRTFKRRLEMIMKGNMATRFSKWTAFSALLLGVVSLPAFAIKPTDQSEDSVGQSRVGVSADQALDEYTARLNQPLNEQLYAETASVSPNAQGLDQKNPVMVSADKQSGRTLQQEQVSPDSELESSTIPKDYTIGVTDVLRIDVWKEPELSIEVIVRPDGKISVPLISDIKASGLTPVQLKKEIEVKLENFVSSPIVTVIVLQFRREFVSIVGQIENPGMYYIDSPITVLELLARAGGLSEFADVNNIAIVRKSRKGSQHFKFNYKDAAKGNNLQNNIILENGDVVIVP